MLITLGTNLSPRGQPRARYTCRHLDCQPRPTSALTIHLDARPRLLSGNTMADRRPRVIDADHSFSPRRSRLHATHKAAPNATASH